MSEVSTLKAMAENYAKGHMWDHLDGEACISAATLIEEQAARIAGLEDVLEEKRGNINSLRARLSEAVKVLEQVSASLAWNAHGDCRAFHEGPIMPTTEAVDLAKDFIATLGEKQES